MATIAKKEKKSDPVPTAPLIRPPAKIGSSGHGPGDGKPQSEMHGSAKLRSVLSLSANVGVEQVCDEAATMIDQLRNADATTKRSLFRRDE